MSQRENASDSNAIAVIGLAGRFPGANNVRQFWDNLVAARESVRRFTREEAVAAGANAALLDRPDFVRAGGVLDGIANFDAGFFNLSPREAETIDPQQRLLLECAWAAFEDAGYDVTRRREAVGVYCGGGMSSYLFHHLHGNPAVDPLQVVLGNDKDFLATRISHKLNLRGPSIGVQTACSSSLVAVHVACQALLAGECDLALAGGVMVSVTQGRGYLYQDGGVLSADGCCRAFDRAANGTVSGNGLAVVVLKPLAAARRDGDRIDAIVRGTAVNNDGSCKVGFTAPSAESQRDVIVEALSVAQVAAETISYVEAHGTATKLGDVIEMKALTDAFRLSTDRVNFCALGAVKTNIGHLDAAAGIAGFIKAVLALRHRTLPASLGFTAPNPEIDFAASPFRVQTRTSAWPEVAGQPRRAGVSSFGIGGTNAHVILEEAPAATPGRESGRPRLVRFSARSADQVRQLQAELLEVWQRDENLTLDDVACTLARRAEFAQRACMVAGSRAEALARLAAASAPDPAAAVREPEGERRDLQDLGARWTGGEEIAWADVPGEGAGRCVSLPTYPFLKSRHWINPPAVLSGATLPRASDIADWFYQPTWKRLGDLAPSHARRTATTDLVLVGDAAAVDTPWIAALGGAARKVSRIYFGAARGSPAPGTYVIDPALRSDYDWVVRQVVGPAATQVRFVHLGNLATGEALEPDETLARGFYSVTFLAQALAQLDPATAPTPTEGMRPFEIVALTSEQCDVLGAELITPEIACLAGPARVIAQEYPRLACRWIDLDALEMYASTPGAVAVLEREVLGDVAEPVVALRRRHRWTEYHEKVAVPGEGAPLPVKAGGVYLLTGGYGGLGMEFAQFLADTAPVKLVLVGRSEFPAREAWPAIRAGRGEPRWAAAVTRIEAMERAGSSVAVLRGDVASAEDMIGLRGGIEARFGRIDGIIHAAGLPFHGLSTDKSRSELAAILAPKVEGVRVLDRVFDFSACDFVVLCSSLRALTGGLGNLDYAAANACLDAYARRRQAEGAGRCVAINWDGWSEVGCGTRASADDPAVEIRSREGVEVLRRVLGRCEPQWIVSTRPLAGVLAMHRQANVLRARNAASAAAPAAPAGGSTEQILTAIWQECLGVPQVGLDDNFFELGGDSIVSIQIMAKAMAHRLSFNSKALYDHPTVRELATAIRPADAAADETVVCGEVPLVPAQRWFFEHDHRVASQWNVSLAITPGRALSPEHLRQALARVVAQHDALRLVFSRRDGRWVQTLPESSRAAELAVVDLRCMPSSLLTATMLEETRRQHERMALDGEPLFRAVLIVTGLPASDRLVLVAHHLVIDHVSAGIVVDDIRRVYEALEAGRAPAPLARTTSFSTWARRLEAHAQMDALPAGRALARAIAAQPVDRVPMQAGATANRVRDARRLVETLDATTTARLVTAIPRANGHETLTLLAGAVARAADTEFGCRRLLIATESHGREAVFRDLDLARTVGWFTSIYPLFVDTTDRPGDGELLGRLGRQLRGAAAAGFEYGLLKYLCRDDTFAQLPCADIELNYLGAKALPYGAAVQDWRVDHFGNQFARHPDNRREYPLQLTVAMVDDRMHVSLEYSERLHAPETAAAFLSRVVGELKSLMAAATVGPAPAASEFPDTELSPEEVAAIAEELTLS